MAAALKPSGRVGRLNSTSGRSNCLRENAVELDVTCERRVRMQLYRIPPGGDSAGPLGVAGPSGPSGGSDPVVRPLSHIPRV
jgi:hypothetical protein